MYVCSYVCWGVLGKVWQMSIIEFFIFIFSCKTDDHKKMLHCSVSDTSYYAGKKCLISLLVVWYIVTIQLLLVSACN